MFKKLKINVFCSEKNTALATPYMQLLKDNLKYLSLPLTPNEQTSNVKCVDRDVDYYNSIY
jgi:hypothetical protein